MRDKTLIVISIVSLVVYLVTSTINYKYDYKAQELSTKVTEYEQKIDELLIEERINLSREEATSQYKLKLNNNWYYLKDQDE